MQCRWMIRADMERVLEIERSRFDHAWTEDDFRMCLRKRNCIGSVVDEHESFRGPAVGFMVYEFDRGTLRVLNMASEADGRGIGTCMVEKLKEKVQQQKLTRLELHTRESNLHAQLFFRSHGFYATGIEDGYYDNGESAYHFEWHRNQGMDWTKRVLTGCSSHTR